MTTAKYLRWKYNGGIWFGIVNDGTVAYRVNHNRVTRRVYLRRLNGSVETCKTVAHAKEYANELARLHNYQPLQTKKGGAA